MAQEHRFRGAFNGFNREDVVRYIEYLNNAHNDLINQLRSENQSLRTELEQLRSAPASTDLEQKCDDLTAQLEETNAQLEALRQQSAVRDVTKEELEAYRRAEKVERDAKERAAQMYRQATGTLAEATTHVDSAAEQFRLIADRVNAQMLELQGAVDNSKNALKDASAILYAIRPENLE